MRIKILRTRDWQEPSDVKCVFCAQVFPLGEVSPVAVSEDDIELGEVCLACVSAGEDHIQAILDKRARWSRAVADQDERIASEGVTDLPSVDELLAAENFYG